MDIIIIEICSLNYVGVLETPGSKLIYHDVSILNSCSHELGCMHLRLELGDSMIVRYYRQSGQLS